MLAFAVKRILWSIPVLIVASIIVFTAMELTTNPITNLAPGLTQSDLQAQREYFGLDQAPHQRYFTAMGNLLTDNPLTGGDFGTSLQTNRPVWDDLGPALANSAQLGLVAFAFYVIVGVSIGTISALRQRSVFDQAATGFSFVLFSVPQFFLGLILIIVVGIYFDSWLFGGLSWLSDRIILGNGTRFDFWSTERAWALVLPALTVAAQQLAVYSRYMRSSMLEALNQDYLRTARAKGVSERRVVIRHGLRNALIPLTTLSALDIAALSSGLIVTEQVFQWSGMGNYFLDSFLVGDTARVLPWVMIVAVAVVLFNVLADIMYGILDPRVRHD